MKDLNAQLLAAHAAEDKALLAKLYKDAAACESNPDAKGFFLTQAYVFALEVGLPQANELRNELVSMGREDPV